MPSKSNLKLVSFDDGGIRGFSQLEIMSNIMHRLDWSDESEESDEHKLPCECFDMIGGCGTGGLIAILLGKLRMSMEEASDTFCTIVEQAYVPDNLSASERTKVLRGCMEDALKSKGLPIDLQLMEKQQVGCPCFVVASPRTNAKSIVCLRTYPVRSQLPSTITIIDAVLATCAAQPVFASIRSGSGPKKREYVSSSGAANPINEVLSEAHLLFGGDTTVSSLLSLGTGHPGIISFPSDGDEAAAFRTMRDMMHDCEQRAQELEQRIGREGVYSRLSVEQGLQNNYAEQVGDLDWIVAQTEDYLNNQETGTKLDLLVKNIGNQTVTVTLDHLRHGSGSNAPGQMAVSVEKSLDILISNQDDATISKLRPAILDCSSPSSGCLEGTRQDILGKINAWGMDFDAPNILWIYGYPGVGKSAIATSAVELWRSSGRFGSSFFFRRDGAESMTPSVLWRTVAHDIGRRDPLIRKHLIGALTEDDSLLTTSNVDALFRQLIHGPLVASTEVAMEKPPIITIDALDECGGLDGRYSDHRKGLMRTLKAWSSLPKKFKLVVTSRRESDIEQLFSGTPHESIGILAGREVVSQSSEDIRAFLRHELRQIVSQYPLMEPDWPGETVIGQLTDLAKGLFIWIKTVIKLLERGQLQRTLKQVLDGAGSMASLYRDILNTSFPNPSNEDTNDFHSILGAIIFAKTPLDVASLTNLFSMDDSTIGYICNGLYSILDPGETLRIHHQSFVDFLLDPKECPAPFLVGRQRENRTLTTACLQVMKKCLRFNICGLESPYICNQDVPDLDSRVKASISPHLSYSSCHWASHLIETNFDAEVYEALQHFMNNQFLFWLEVLSFIKRVNVGSNMLRLLITWIKQFDQDVALAVDMRKFMVAFAYVISQSVPHIYVSALPFAPRCLAVSRKYIGSYPQTLNFQRGGCKNWPAMQCVFSGHTQWVWSVSFSPDGTRIVSGSSDNTIRVWDAETGETLTGPLEGHTDEVSSVSFFPDGTRIISGSFDHTIRVWDAATGEKVMEPWEGHDDQISSVAISPDGIRIVSGSNDKTIRVWDARTGATVVGPLAGHTSEINCVSFSPDGTRIVSGSSDETIRVWDAATGEIVMEILKGHDAQVWSVAFSPDGTRIISGSFDNTIRIWDADTGKPLTEPLEGHKNWVRSVVFSPDGTRILSGSDDRSIRLWDAQMGKTVIEPLRGHTWAIMSVSFSPDGTRIASGAADGTLRVWDVEEGKKVIELQEEHKYWVNSVPMLDNTYISSSSNDNEEATGAQNADMSETTKGPFQNYTDKVMNVSFSPDGMRIFSLSRSTTICGWDAETGEAVIKPVECHIDRVMCVALSLDGAHVVVGSKDNVIRVWDAKTGEAVIEPVEGHKDWVTCVSFSLDGRRIISGSYDTTILVWDSATGEAVLGPLEGHTTELTCVSFSPDGKLIASGSQDSTIRVWDAETGETIIGPLEGHYLVNSILFSPDSTRIVSGYGDYTVRVWDVTTGKTVVGPLFGHNGSVGSVSFSPDGTLIVSGSEDRTIRVWDAKTGERVIGPLEGHLTGVNHVSFSPDGTRIVSCSFDNTIRVWDLHTDISSVHVYSIFQETPRTNDGWVLGPGSERLFWVPPAIRSGLCPLANTVVIGGDVTQLDLRNFVHGEAWIRCRDRLL